MKKFNELYADNVHPNLDHSMTWRMTVEMMLNSMAAEIEAQRSDKILPICDMKFGGEIPDICDDCGHKPESH